MGGDLGESALVGIGEVAHVEVALHNLGLAEESGLEDITLLELLVGAYCIVAGVGLCVGDTGCLLGCCLGETFSLDVGVERVYAGVEVSHCGCEFLNLYIGRCELVGESGYLG